MVRFLSLADNLHAVLQTLHGDMIRLCEPLSVVSMAIAGIGALLYIAYRVWQSLARAEPIDLLPLLRPFAIGVCILFFPTLVLGGLNGILSPLTKATHSLMQTQIFDMNEWRQKKTALETESRRRMPPDSYYEKDERMERQLDELGMDDDARQTLDRMDAQTSSWSLKGLLMSLITWILELLFTAASVILDVLRTFYLIVLSILGPVAFAISVFDGFQGTIVQWFSKYVSIYLWLPISDIFSAIIARLQSLSLQHDTELMAQDSSWLFDAANTVNLIVMLVAICGFLCIPSIATWVVQAGGFASYNRLLNKASMVSGKWAAQKAWAGARNAAGAAGRGLAGAARLIRKR